MEPVAVGALVFACAFLGSLAGIKLRSVLPQHHFSSESKETVLLAVGLVATMTALILGLVTASAKSSFDALDAAVKDVVADVLTLDRILARYGPEARPLREQLQQFVESRMSHLWPEQIERAERPDVSDVARPERMFEQIRALQPENAGQRGLQSRALQLGESILEARWGVFSGIGASIPVPFMTVLVFWLTMIFGSFGLFAPRNGTVIAALFTCSLSVAGAIFLILEMDGPFTGVIRISPEPVHYALARINR